MGYSKESARMRGCVKVGGREYVSLTTCALRLGISHSSLSEATSKGYYTRQALEGYKGLWFDWEKTRAAFNRNRRKQDHVKGGRRGKKTAAVTNTVPLVNDIGLPGVPSAEVGAVEMPTLPKGAENILAYFDPEADENADCWEIDDSGEYLFIPGTTRHYIDWKKAIDKCMANLRYQQYMREKGDLIPKTQVVQMLSLIFPPVTATIMQMPDKYASRVNGRVEEMIGRPMTNEETTVMKAILVDESERICRNLQDAIEKTMEEADDK